MQPLPYDPKEVRERCLQAARRIAREGGAPTVAFNVVTGRILRAFDRSDPAEREFIERFAGLPFRPPASRSSLMLLAYREDDGGTRRLTRSIEVRLPGAQAEH